MSDRWYVAATHPKAEALAAEQLNAQGFDTFLPLKEERKIIRRKVVDQASPLFPSYLFIRFDREIQRWRSVNGTRGIKRLICDGNADMPLPLRAGIVEELQLRADQGEFGIKPELGVAQIKVGAPVKIISGPFIDFEGICKLSQGERVWVLLSKFERASRIEFRADQVIAA